MPTAKGKTLPRIINMMQLIPITPRWTTAKILQLGLENRGFTVTKRTVERDLVEVADLFGLVSSDSPDGYKWSYSRKRSDIFLPSISAEEALSLQLVEQHLEDYFPKEVFSQLNAIFKKSKDTLVRSKSLHSWPSKIANLPHVLAFKPLNINTEIKSLITQGILEQRKLEITYGNSDSIHLISPIGMVVRDTKLVLICYFYDYEEPRHLLFHRVNSAKLLNETFDTDFDTSKYIQTGAVGILVNAELIDVKLTVKGYAKELFQESVINVSQKVSDEKAFANSITQDDWIDISIQLPHTLELENWLMGLSDQIIVKAPKQLKSRVIRRMIKSLGQYGVEVK
ncbi:MULTISPECIES: helix-turn-helix transcriptional regulator [Pseudoalteromonas]|nr:MULTISPECIES: WYL domain-containing protein [Pseudoalteromonas]MBH0002826.1 WYL domain-containing protein [Pseudoalteromonas sp. SWYJZ12]